VPAAISVGPTCAGLAAFTTAINITDNNGARSGATATSMIVGRTLTAYNITRRDHCLQPATTRALHDGKDEEYVVVALLHDTGESLGPFNHGEVIASILCPFVCRDK
jgi:hypothetical protein